MGIVLACSAFGYCVSLQRFHICCQHLTACRRLAGPSMRRVENFDIDGQSIDGLETFFWEESSHTNCADGPVIFGTLLSNDARAHEATFELTVGSERSTAAKESWSHHGRPDNCGKTQWRERQWRT